METILGSTTDFWKVANLPTPFSLSVRPQGCLSVGLKGRGDDRNDLAVAWFKLNGKNPRRNSVLYGKRRFVWYVQWKSEDVLDRPRYGVGLMEERK